MKIIELSNYNVATLNPIELIESQKIDLLKSTGSYNVSRYPWAYDCWKRQQQIHWMPEEVPLGEDLKDWQSDKITPAERNLLTQIFRLFTQSDIEVADNYMKNYIGIFKPLEIQMMLAAFSNIESIHIEAYALLLKTLGMPEIEFEAFKEYKEMRNKIDYMHKFNIIDCKNLAKTLAMFGAFTEGMSLFASFAMLLNFSRFNKMKGMGQIISWSVRDESLHCEGMIRLYHEFINQTGIMTQDLRDEIIDIAHNMVTLESKFIDLAFNLGDIQGLTANEVKSYIRYITDWRLCQLKIEPIYGYFEDINNEYKQIEPHPLPWLLEILNGVEHANFFETRATEYSKASTTGNWDGSDGVWNIFDKTIKHQ